MREEATITVHGAAQVLLSDGVVVPMQAALVSIGSAGFVEKEDTSLAAVPTVARVRETPEDLTLDAASRASEGNVKTHNNPIVNVYPVDPANSFRVDGKINSKSVSFLLDTGAAVSLIRKDIWDQEYIK